MNNYNLLIIKMDIATSNTNKDDNTLYCNGYLLYVIKHNSLLKYY